MKNNTFDAKSLIKFFEDLQETEKQIKNLQKEAQKSYKTYHKI